MLEGWCFGERSTGFSIRSAETKISDNKKISMNGTPSIMRGHCHMDKFKLVDTSTASDKFEQSRKVSMFLTTFMYFRALYLVNQSQYGQEIKTPGRTLHRSGKK